MLRLFFRLLRFNPGLRALAAVPGLAPPETIFIELETTTGETAHLILNDFSPIMPTLPAHLVKASWLADLHGFPEKMTPEEIITGNEPPEFTDDFPTYLANVVSNLNPQSADSFTPDLTGLDAMMSSLEIK